MSRLLSNKVEKYLKRISEIDDKIKAWEEVFTEFAMIQAEHIDNKKNKGALYGLIIGVKDIFDFQGRPPCNGAVVTTHSIPKQNATIVQRLFDEGALIIGTTKLTEFCYFKPCSTRNPHNVEHTPGGSSSGSAAAIGADMADATIGSQTKGSTIRPASYCGIYGFKPSLGGISTAGSTHLTTTLDHPGIFANNTHTLNKIFNALIGYDSNDSTSCYLPDINNKSRFKIGYIDLNKYTEISSDMNNHFSFYLSQIKKSGHEIEEVELPVSLEEIEDIWQGIFYPEVHHHLGYLKESNEYDLVGEEIRGAIEKGEKASLNHYLYSLKRRNNLAYKMDKLFQSNDFILLPSARDVAPKGINSTGDPICTVLTSLLGLPVVNIPVGVNEHGLPLGLQLISRKYYDKKVISSISDLPAKMCTHTQK
ncbi:amidase [Salicibibacter cibarius]|uniref:Amidase n=1 Tax=Salicibibacter cibarius TaxID=2743000 RepID=A0A7T7CAA7_9BACI|nr:amidase [Salicibibacter cibarius]QQK74702.1 amidase [Salicibibacter cibarius]